VKYRLLACCVVAALTPVALAAPAAAHSRAMYHGSDIGDVNTSHTSYTVKDNECDGYQVAMHGSWTGADWVTIVIDHDGCGGTYSGFVGQTTAKYVRTCEVYNGGTSVSSCTSTTTL
jgi:hypothetical protein